MKKTYLSLTFLALLVASALYFVPALRAQSPAPSTPSTGLTITPPTFEINGNPGDTIKNTVRLDNNNTYPVEIAVDRRNFTAIGEEGAVGLTEDQTSYSLASWIEVTPANVTLPAKSSQYFNFSIKIPLQAEPGGHFGSLIFRTIPHEKLEGSGASLAQEIGSLILLRLAGETVELSSIESFAAAHNLYEYGPVNFEARLKNLGNVHTKPEGTITITNLLGQQVAVIQVEPKNILPGAIRKLDATWDTKWRLGRYTATFNAVLGDNSQRSATTTFIVLPYRVVGVALLVVIVICLILRKYRKRLSLAWKILRSGRT